MCHANIKWFKKRGILWGDMTKEVRRKGLENENQQIINCVQKLCLTSFQYVVVFTRFKCRLQCYMCMMKKKVNKYTWTHKCARTFLFAWSVCTKLSTSVRKASHHFNRNGWKVDEKVRWCESRKNPFPKKWRN